MSLIICGQSQANVFRAKREYVAQHGPAPVKQPVLHEVKRKDGSKVMVKVVSSTSRKVEQKDVTVNAGASAPIDYAAQILKNMKKAREVFGS